MRIIMNQIFETIETNLTSSSSSSLSPSPSSLSPSNITPSSVPSSYYNRSASLSSSISSLSPASLSSYGASTTSPGSVSVSLNSISKVFHTNNAFNEWLPSSSPQSSPSPSLSQTQSRSLNLSPTKTNTIFFPKQTDFSTRNFFHSTLSSKSYGFEKESISMSGNKSIAALDETSQHLTRLMPIGGENPDNPMINYTNFLQFGADSSASKASFVNSSESSLFKVANSWFHHNDQTIQKNYECAQNKLPTLINLNHYNQQNSSINKSQSSYHSNSSVPHYYPHHSLQTSIAQQQPPSFLLSPASSSSPSSLSMSPSLPFYNSLTSTSIPIAPITTSHSSSPSFSFTPTTTSISSISNQSFMTPDSSRQMIGSSYILDGCNHQGSLNPIASYNYHHSTIDHQTLFASPSSSSSCSSYLMSNLKHSMPQQQSQQSSDQTVASNHHHHHHLHHHHLYHLHQSSSNQQQQSNNYDNNSGTIYATKRRRRNSKK